MGINHAFITQLKSLLENEKKLDFSNGSFLADFIIFTRTSGKVTRWNSRRGKIQVIQQIIDLASDYPNCNFQEEQK